MKVSNLESPRTGKPVANQFLITEEGRGANGNFLRRETFQSYESTIAILTRWHDRTDVVLDEKYWDYSSTTSKYRNQFLCESTKETKKKIASGEYQLANLN